MIISCSTDIGQEEFIKSNSKNATFIDSSLSIDDYINKIKEANQEYDFVFTSSDKNQVLNDNSIRFYAALLPNEACATCSNQIRIKNGETISDKLRGFDR